ncbi:tetratricopeptide repeat protein [Roseovarius dicentrarchi]|uniref:tetratricopeptide repeat protein n=1 Tax=Roseovarius dicentrarchi TaxID=2250573 RepID=UPI001EEFFE24|nr:tetratricopeptide repeat protein [Roseovarius dicentrarchi]
MTIRFLTILALVAPTLTAPIAASADDAAGPYLATRAARFDSDYAAAARYALIALKADPDNLVLLDSAVGALLATGEVEKALPIAQRMQEAEIRSQLAQMVLLGDAAATGDFATVLEMIEAEQAVGPLADGLIAAWATLGTGDMGAALKKFDAIAAEPGLRSLAVYHKALALASVGDFESADKIYAGETDGPMQTTRRSVIAWAEVLSQLERNDDAIKVLDDTFGTDADPQVADLRARLTEGERLNLGRIETPRQGISEVFLSLGMALLQDTSPDYVLLYTRLAEYLDPNDVDAMIMTGELLAQLGRYELASEAFKRVPKSSPSYYTSELSRAEALRSSGDLPGSIAIVASLRQSHPAIALVHASAGDLYRQNDQFQEAVEAYDAAITRYKEKGDEPWFVVYSRAISYERLGKWPEAEADFRRALELNPDEPMVLNYLGYSLVEQRSKLDEALDMIERAVQAEPNSGAIVDSLGWAQFRLGRYAEAVVNLERAAELYAVDPVVNDHLGDAMWAVGRQTEARFQWRRALSLVDMDKPNPDVDPDRIRRKLEVGLDAVLEEEGAKPLKVSDDEG